MKSPLKRIAAYAKVFRYFGYFPSFGRFLSIFYGTRPYVALRFLKRKLTLASS